MSNPPSSFEARLVHALADLRRVQGTNAALVLERTRAETMVADAREAFERLSHLLAGEGRKDALQMERRCQDWQTHSDGINIG